MMATHTDAPTARTTLTDSRIERLSGLSRKRLIEPDEAFTGGIGPGQVLPDELLSIAGLDLDLTPEQRATLSREEVASIAANVRLGPWIHVESDASYFGLVHDGETLSTRGRVLRVWEQREHKFVTIDVGMFAGSDIRPVVRGTHTAIYEPRSR